MIRWVAQLDGRDGVAPAAIDAALGDLGTLAGRVRGVGSSRAGRHLPGSVGGGAATWDLVGDRPPSEVLAEHPEAAVAVVVRDAVALAPIAGRTVATPPPLVKRTLLLAVRPGVDPATVQRFEVELAAMADHIATIRSAALSRVDQDRSPSRFTHVWEQEYASVEGLRGDYMRHPYHWAGVDRWFDHEMPDRIVDDELAHVFYESPEPVLADPPAAPAGP